MISRDYRLASAGNGDACNHPGTLLAEMHGTGYLVNDAFIHTLIQNPLDASVHHFTMN